MCFILHSYIFHLKLFYLYCHTYMLTLLQAEDFLNPCKVGELFSENFQNVQTSQLIIYKKKTNKT